jgi:aminoglycoside 6'-N-acetyltransferase
MPADYALHAMTEVDLAMVATWLAMPHVQEWWVGPAEQLASVTESLGEPEMDQQIASCGTRPFGYLQSYPVHAWPASAPHLADFPAGTVGISCFVGPTDMIGQGHGAAMVRLYAQHLLERGAPEVVLDPASANEHAVRAYRRAGFRDVAQRADGDGEMTLVMRFDPFSLA